MIGVEFNPLAGGLLDKVTGGKINQIADEYLGGLVAAELMNNYQVITAYTLNNPNVIRLEPPLIVSGNSWTTCCGRWRTYFRSIRVCGNWCWLAARG